MTALLSAKIAIPTTFECRCVRWNSRSEDGAQRLHAGGGVVRRRTLQPAGLVLDGGGGGVNVMWWWRRRRGLRRCGRERVTCGVDVPIRDAMVGVL